MKNSIESIAPYDDEHLGFKKAAKELQIDQREIARLIFIGKLPHTREIVFPWRLEEIYANRKRIYFQRRDIEEYKKDSSFYKALSAINPAEWFPNTNFSRASDRRTGQSTKLTKSKPNQKKVDLTQTLQNYIHVLSDKQYKAFSLKFEYGLSLQEVADQMQISKSTAAGHVNAAKQIMKHQSDNERRRK